MATDCRVFRGGMPVPACLIVLAACAALTHLSCLPAPVRSSAGAVEVSPGQGAAVAPRVPAWPQWRGPHQDGHSRDPRAPLRWGPDDNLKWQTDLPGFGNSSPVVWGERVFLTSATGTGTERWVLCIDRTSGKILWQQTAAKGLPAEPVHAWNTHASATCATDGERVYAFFGTLGLFCYDFKGKLLWKKDIGPLVASTGWGAGAASPVLFGDLVVVNGDHGALRGQRDENGKDYGDSWLWALNKRTGELVWKTKRNQGMGWGTPVIWAGGGRQELVLNGQLGVWSYDPRTGKELWHVVGRRPGEGFGEVTPVWGHGLLLVFTGKPGPAWAIRPGGRGDVSKTHVAWRIKRKERDVSSPVLIGDYLYTVSRTGIATCLEARTGKEVWRERLGGEPCASLLCLRGKALILSDDGTTYVLEPGPTFKLLRENKLGDGDAFRASPAVAGGQLLIRSDRRLYCVESGAKRERQKP
jgi:outer membrane protein assembly factor BamB